MARKVFISFLGTNNYLQTKYKLNNVESKVVRFIQQALIEFLCADWTENDRVMIFYTEASFKANWVDNGHERLNEGAEIEKIGLESTLKGMNFPMKIESYKIDEGFSEEEIWSIFTSVYSQLEKGDQIYLDVTHAFRSIPLFSVVLFNYARFMQNTQLVSIHYGAFEKLGPAYKVKEIPVENRIAPILDLTSLANLQSTNIAASNFIEFGKVGTIANQLDKMAVPSNIADKSSDAIKVLKEQLAELDYYIETCRIKDIRKGAYFQKINERINAVMKARQLHNPEKELLKRIQQQLVSFGFEATDTEENVRAAIEWALQYNMLQQTYTLGQEFVISKVASLIEKLDDNKLQFAIPGREGDFNKGAWKEFIGGILGVKPGEPYRYNVIDHKVDKSNQEQVVKQRTNLANSLLQKDWIWKLKGYYNVLRENRNSLNHGKGGCKKMEDLINDFKNNFNPCLDIIKEQNP